MASLAQREMDEAGDASNVSAAATAAAAAAAAGLKRRPGGRWLVGDLAVSRRRDGLEMKSPLEDGLLSDWEQVWGLAYIRRIHFCNLCALLEMCLVLCFFVVFRRELEGWVREKRGERLRCW